MAVLVTGGNGFVGINLVRHLAQHKLDVLSLDVSADDERAKRYLDDALARVEFVTGDVSRLTALRAAISTYPVEYIVHAAAITSWNTNAIGGYQRMLEVNLMGTINLLELARSLTSLQRLVFISSGAIYGSSPEGRSIREDHPHNGKTLYAITKSTSEYLVRRYAALFQLGAVSLRLGWTYGPMERPTGSRVQMSTICDLARCSLKGEEIRINDVLALRDWTHVEDVAKAVHMLLSARHVPSSVYNISAGVGYSTQEVLHLLEQEIPGSTYALVSENEANVRINTDNRRGPLDIARLRTEMGYEPTYTLEKGLASYLAWLKTEGQYES